MIDVLHGGLVLNLVSRVTKHLGSHMLEGPGCGDDGRGWQKEHSHIEATVDLLCVKWLACQVLH